MTPLDAAAIDTTAMHCPGSTQGSSRKGSQVGAERDSSRRNNRHSTNNANKSRQKSPAVTVPKQKSYHKQDFSSDCAHSIEASLPLADMSTPVAASKGKPHGGHAHAHAFTSPANSRCIPESISSSKDEVVSVKKGNHSDPIGCVEHDLGSGGPLDDGVTPCFTTPTRAQPSRTASVTLFDLWAAAAETDDFKHPNGSPRSHIHDDATDTNEHTGAPVSTVITKRRESRAQTAPGIPLHRLRLLLGESASILEEARNVEQGSIVEQEELKLELDAHKRRIRELEEQVTSLTLRLGEESRKNCNLTSSLNGAGGAAHLNSQWFTPSLSPRSSFDQVPDTPVSVKLPSVTNSPDPFSPFPPAQQNHVRSPVVVRTNYGPSIHAIKNAAHLSTNGFQHLLAADALSCSKEAAVGMPFAGPYNGPQIHAHSPTTLNDQPYLDGLRVSFNNNTDMSLAHNHGSESTSYTTSTSLSEQAALQAMYTGFGSACDAHAMAKLCTSPYVPSIYNASLQSSPERSPSTEMYYDHHGRAFSTECNVPVHELIERALGQRNQEASIVLQQQLKTAGASRKRDIIEGLAPHLLHLAEDKHGNFLVQRAIGVDYSLADRLYGNFVRLSLSQFGCHVVLKLLEGEEDICKQIVLEILSFNVMDTLTSRTSIHIWQKIFGLQWTDQKIRAHIFDVVNDTMRGRWAETAMLETGSIICQNIFESADGMEKGDCLSEVLHSLADCAASQWGVWVVEHIIEHGDCDTRQAAFEKLISKAIGLTLSPHGNKAIMSALKTKDPYFLAAYTDTLCGSDTEQSQTFPASSGALARRHVIVDIAVAPHGLQLISQLITSASKEEQGRLVKLVRKNSVFLKGSKAGMRVHQLCDRARAYTGY